MITNRAELEEAFVVGVYIDPDKEDTIRHVIKTYNAWLSEQGFALVPKEPTNRMVTIAQTNKWRVRRANNVGDVLRRDGE